MTDDRPKLGIAHPPPIVQIGGCVQIQTPQMLAAAYRATLYGIQRRSRDGLPPATYGASRRRCTGHTPPRWRSRATTWRQTT